MLHAKAMSIVVAYDIYLELAEGMVNNDWKLNKPVDFYTFRETLARQMLSYNPRNVKYLGDDKFRAFTQTAKAKRAPSPPLPPATDGTITTTTAGISEAALAKGSTKKRLCGFMGTLKDHFEACGSMERGKKLNCAFCNRPTYQFCSLCEVPMHKFVDKESREIPCFYHWHDTGCFGLAKVDWKITNKKMKDWTFPSLEEMNDNVKQMKQLSEQVNGNNNNSNNSHSDSPSATVTSNSSSDDSD
jgi:hypothetical protein